MGTQDIKNVDAKAAELREKLEDESLDKSKVEGGIVKDYTSQNNYSSSSGK